jgi:hypothetical protein
MNQQLLARYENIMSRNISFRLGIYLSLDYDALGTGLIVR